MDPAEAGPRPRRLVAVSLNTAIDKLVSVDRLVPGSIHRPRLLGMVPGGKALNVARAANHLGLPAAAVVVLGGHAGRWCAEALEGAGVGVLGVTVAGETRTCTSVLDEATGALTELYEAGVPLPAARWPQVEAALAALLADDEDGGGTLVVMSGSLPPGAPQDAYARLGAIAGAAGAPWVVDSDGAALAPAIAARPWLVKVNAQEAARATGIHDALEAARAILALGPTAAIVTRGVDGAVLATRVGAWEVGPPPELGRYAVGSGDAFLAGLARGLADGLGLSGALAVASAAGTASALVPGQGELDPRDVTRLVPRSRVTRVH
jgi:1-phosphofructokinase family hexose kinase